MSEECQTYINNSQLQVNVVYQLYCLELAVVITKTVIMHCNHINFGLWGDNFPHSTLQYTVAWTKNSFGNISPSGSIYTIVHLKIYNIAMLLAILRS